MKEKNHAHKQNRRMGNDGVSLVELVVVIAIMAVLVGFSALSISILNGKQAKQCRDELVSKLESVRVQTMGKESVVAHLYKDTASGTYVLKVTSTVKGTGTDTEIKLPSSRCTIYYSLKEADTYGSADNKLLDDSGIDLEFDRASGALKKQNVGGVESCVYHIYVVENSKVYGLRLYQETGKIVLE